jgi:gamma-glutamylcyclotransferase (GGCT)/AIG2-like uncharacterized protein YtfP
VSESQKISHIVGEVYEVDDRTMAVIDHLESCFPARDGSGAFEANSWYIRKQISVKLDGYSSHVNVWMYFNEHETRHPIICSGNYANRQDLEHPQDRFWYFAYGSNMDVSRMLNRGAYFTQRILGVMNDHRLVFNKIADSSPGFGYANTVPEQGFNVKGILYEVNADGLVQLDKYEGVRGRHYYRANKIIFRSDGSSVNAVVYLAHPDKVQDGLLPTATYKTYLYQGLDILGEEGKEYLNQALQEARVTDDERFLIEQNIPSPSADDHIVDVRQHALPVLLNGHKVKMYLHNRAWSECLVFHCEPDVAPYFQAMDLNVDGMGFFGTKHFDFIRRGILKLGHLRLVLELDDEYMINT